MIWKSPPLDGEFPNSTTRTSYNKTEHLKMTPSAPRKRASATKDAEYDSSSPNSSTSSWDFNPKKGGWYLSKKRKSRRDSSSSAAPQPPKRARKTNPFIVMSSSSNGSSKDNVDATPVPTNTDRGTIIWIAADQALLESNLVHGRAFWCTMKSAFSENDYILPHHLFPEGVWIRNYSPDERERFFQQFLKIVANPVFDKNPELVKYVLNQAMDIRLKGRPYEIAAYIPLVHTQYQAMPKSDLILKDFEAVILAWDEYATEDYDNALELKTMSAYQHAASEFPAPPRWLRASYCIKKYHP